MNQDRKILIFDGVCNLCHAGVNFIIQHDQSGKVKFTQAQSEIGLQLQKEAGIDILKEDTTIFFDGDKIFTYGKAATRVYKYFDGAWKVLYLMHFIPAFILNPIYNIIAKNRYKWFGQKDQCMMPNDDIKSRFLS